MKKTLIASIVLAAALAVAGCGSKEAEETTESAVETQAPVVETQAQVTEEALAPIIGGEVEGGSQADAFPTGIPLNQDAYTELAEPAMYEVLEDCITWSGNDVQTSGGDLVAGSIVTVVASDGNYLILDDQRVVEASHLQLFE